VRVKYRGKINDTIKDILGGVRSSCTYVGAPSLKQLSKCTTFVRVTKQFNEDDIVYEDKIYTIEKELLDMIDEEKQYEKRYNYLKEKYGVVK
jgi:hypothetical protein